MAKTQARSYPLRLPDSLQAPALRLLDASRTAINAMLTVLWPSLDAFASDRTGPAWKQVDALLLERPGHGSRQERCEMEQAGRLLRAQATRKQVFQTILPLLGVGLIRPAEGKRPELKDYRAIKDAVRVLRADLEDADSFMALTNVVEQACNVYLEAGTFPVTYEELQPIPVQQVAQLTFAGDDGMEKGQTYHIQPEFRGVRCDLKTQQELSEGFLGYLSANEAVYLIPHDLLRGQRLLVYQAGGTATVTRAGDHPPPFRGQTHSLCWLVVFDLVTHLAIPLSSCFALCLGPEKVCPEQCVKSTIVRVSCNGIK
jgi:hypothetical protein